MTEWQSTRTQYDFSRNYKIKINYSVFTVILIWFVCVCVPVTESTHVKLDIKNIDILVTI